MKKILFFTLMFSCLISTTALAENEDITSEDFEKYSLNAIYNSGELTVSYPDMDDATLSGKYIINAAGGIYEGEDVYEGNAADNIVTYAKTSDTTAIAVPGGLDNGWHGAYSHPMLYLQGGQGASSEYNTLNRRLSVISSDGGNVLALSPATNAYVSTSSWYGYDEIDFSKPVIWETDVKIRGISQGKFELSLTKGKFSEIKPFAYASHDCGRSLITPVVTFSPEGKILIFGEEAGEYSKNVKYKVSVFIDNTGENPVYSVTVKDGENAVIETEKKQLEFDLSGVTGVDYYASTQKGDSKITDVCLDNITIAHVVYSGIIKSSNAVAINGTGVCLLEFSDAFDEETINDEAIKVYDPNGEEVEGVSVSVNSTISHRVLLRFTDIELEPSSVYTITMYGVKNKDGIRCESTAEFKTVDLVKISSATESNGTVNYSIKNNANKETSVTIVIVGFKDGKIVSDGVYYKRVDFTAKGTTTEEIEVEYLEAPDTVKAYIIDSIGGFSALTPQKEL